jgi:Sulfotransferase family
VTESLRSPARSDDADASAGERILVFLHIPKTAGSTVLRILEREYGRAAVLLAYDARGPEEVASRIAAAAIRPRVVAGHFDFGVDRALPVPSTYMAFLRDPVQRVLSHYEFVRRQDGHYLYGAASRLTFADYVRSCGGAEPNNDQTRLLAGTGIETNAGSAGPEMLPVAKSHIDQLGAVGLTEEFDASLILMRRAFGWRRPLYLRRNVSHERVAVESLSADARAVVEAHNALDLELYDYARDRFHGDLAAQAGDFERELRRFRRLNVLYRGSGALEAIRPSARERS